MLYYMYMSSGHGCISRMRSEEDNRKNVPSSLSYLPLPDGSFLLTLDSWDKTATVHMTKVLYTWSILQMSVLLTIGVGASPAGLVLAGPLSWQFNSL